MDVKHTEFMELALEEAKKAAQKDEVPVGAVLISETGDILARAHNQTITLKDPSAHAEIIALRHAAQKVSNYRLTNTVLYVTIEPCIMCMGAIVHARIKTVVFGAKDPKWGAAGSIYDFATEEKLNHRTEIISGICESQCRELIKSFFSEKRKSVATNTIMS